MSSKRPESGQNTIITFVEVVHKNASQSPQVPLDKNGLFRSSVINDTHPQTAEADWVSMCDICYSCWLEQPSDLMCRAHMVGFGALEHLAGTKVA